MKFYTSPVHCTVSSVIYNFINVSTTTPCHFFSINRIDCSKPLSPPYTRPQVPSAIITPMERQSLANSCCIVYRRRPLAINSVQPEFVSSEVSLLLALPVVYQARTWQRPRRLPVQGQACHLKLPPLVSRVWQCRCEQYPDRCSAQRNKGERGRWEASWNYKAHKSFNSGGTSSTPATRRGASRHTVWTYGDSNRCFNGRQFPSNRVR